MPIKFFDMFAGIGGFRSGFEDVRGTLFFEIARIASSKRPKYLFLENVLGLLNHNHGRTFKKSSLHWMNWGMMSSGRCVTAKISEFPSQEKECILSDIIERNIEEKYYLSLKQMQKLLYKGYQAKKENAYIPLMWLALL